MSGRNQVGPNALLLVEQSLSVLEGVDLDTRTALKSQTIDGDVTGMVLNELREIRVEETQAGDGFSDAEIRVSMESWMGRLDDSGLFERVLGSSDQASTLMLQKRGINVSSSASAAYWMGLLYNSSSLPPELAAVVPNCGQFGGRVPQSGRLRAG